MRRSAAVVLLLVALGGAVDAAPPSIFYADLTSGPAAGGQDNNGAFVTIVGRNFGSERGNGSVSVGCGQADNYPVWSNGKIVFQLGQRARSGKITVMTADGISNGIPFTVRPGRIFFVSARSARDPGSGTFDDPWRSPRSYYTAMRPGDICYFRAGAYTGRYGRQTYPYQVAFDDSVPSGAPDNEIAWVGYPGEIAYFQAQEEYPGNFGLYGFGRQHYVIAGLNMYSIGNGRGAIRIFDDHNRVVNCRIEGIKTLSYGMFEVRAHAGTKIWGNECFGASSGNKLDHILYCQGGADDVDFGWNYVHDNDIAVGPVISIHEDGGHAAGAVFENIRIHDNLIDCRNSSGALRVLGTVDAAPGGSVYLYNNIIVEAGSTVNYYDAIYLCSCSVYICNNTFYRFRGNGSYAVRLRDSSDRWHPETVEIRNNIFYNQPNCRYIGLDSKLARVTVEANCYFGGEGDPPVIDRRQIADDPGFVDTATLNFHLRPDSPCVRKGAAPASCASRDYDGRVRLSDRTDIGALQRTAPGTNMAVRSY